MKTAIAWVGLFTMWWGLFPPTAAMLRAQSPLTSGLVAYYPFDGNASDAAGTNHGTVVSAVTTMDRFSRANRAYHFNGVNSYIAFAAPPLSQMANWTISAWVLPSTLPQLGILVTLGYDDGTPMSANGVSFGIASPGGNSGTDFTAAFAGIVWVSSGDAFSTTSHWSHLVVTRGARVTRFYVNGTATPNSSEVEPRLPTAFRIGAANCESPTRFFQGAIDDVRIYDRALAPEEVKQLYGTEARAIISVGKAIYLDSGNLWIGASYQLQASRDMITWTNTGAPFMATNVYWRTPDYWEMDNWGELFFRLELVP
jgi:hypothetical protein